MAADLSDLLSQTGALLTGHFRLSSGLHSPNYVQCALLLEHPANASKIGEALGERLLDVQPERIVSPALGGIVIGYAVASSLRVPMIFTERKDGRMTLRRGFSVGELRRCVIVEDVVTTGKSTRETAATIEEHGGEVVGYASILNRSGHANPFGTPYSYLMSMKLETYTEADCPLCSENIPLDSPGSRFPATS